jgi:protein SCO1
MQHAAGQFGRWRRPVWPGAVAALLILLAAAFPARAQVLMKEDPEDLKGVDLVQKLGEQVPLDVPIVDSTGKTVELGSYFNQGKPVVLALVYYDCPMICPLLLSRLQDRLNDATFTVGEDYNVVVVSFDPTNTTEMAAANKATYLMGYNRKKTPEVEAGWSFHTAAAGNARVIAESVGFKYRYLEDVGEYAHPAVLMVLTPGGKVARYISGLDANKGELRLALLDASDGKIAKTIGDFFLHRCYRYDPKNGAYTLHAMRVMQMGGLGTLLAIGTLIAGLRAGERIRAHRRSAAGARAESGSSDLGSADAGSADLGPAPRGAGPVMGRTT